MGASDLTEAVDTFYLIGDDIKGSSTGGASPNPESPCPVGKGHGSVWLPCVAVAANSHFKMRSILKNDHTTQT